MHIINFLKNICLKVEIFFYSFMHGTKAVGDVLTSSNGDNNSLQVTNEQKVNEENLYSNLLKENVTEEVIEARDKNYRVYRESGKYRYLGNGNVEKKDNSLSEKHVPLYEDENKILLIQDNHEIVKGVLQTLRDIEDKNNKAEFLLKIKRKNFPKFKIENFTKRIIIKENNIIELYCSKYPRQYIPIDSLFISEMLKIMDNPVLASDILDIEEIEFVTEKAFGADDIKLCKFNNINYINTIIFDGNFVIRLSADVVDFCRDLTAKYKTKELDEKYAKKEHKKNNNIGFVNAIEIIHNHLEDKKIEESISLKEQILKLK